MLFKNTNVKLSLFYKSLEFLIFIMKTFSILGSRDGEAHVAKLGQLSVHGQIFFFFYYFPACIFSDGQGFYFVFPVSPCNF